MEFSHNRISPWTVRAAVVFVLLLSTFVVAGGFAAVSGQATNVYVEQSNLPPGERTAIVGERQSATVITFSGNGPLVLLEPNGTVGYYSEAYDSFWDVDPIPGTKRTVLMGASDEYDVDECPGPGSCTRNFVLRWNLSTGERTVLLSRFRPELTGSEWHDIDAVDPDRSGDAVIVADIEQSRIFLVNTQSGLTTWSYSVQEDYPLRSGGSWPGGSWTHLNDVEVTPSDQIMVSLRNQDSVIFIDQDGSLNETMTLGSDDAHEILFEQHNPDYIPASDGGPALLVADSQNDRIVEYQRTDDNWTESWVWRDGQLQWPRDADRLPNGHTLITDTNADRILEIDTTGKIVWSHKSPPGLNPYEVERFGTGDESEDGPSAEAAGLNSRNQDSIESGGGERSGVFHRPGEKIWTTIKRILPNKIINALLFVKPAWLTSADLPVIFVSAVVLTGWLVFEIRRLELPLSVRNPIVINRE